MVIDDRLRALREEKKFSQGNIEKRTGLLRSYIPASRTATPYLLSRRLKSLLAPLRSPCTNFSMRGEDPPELPNLPKRKTADDIAWGSNGKDARMLAKFCR